MSLPVIVLDDGNIGSFCVSHEKCYLSLQNDSPFTESSNGEVATKLYVSRALGKATSTEEREGVSDMAEVVARKGESIF